MSVSREVPASPSRLYEMVSDVTRMGEWSPETEGAVWLGGATAARAGARFRGTNRVGKKSWKTVATVVGAEPARGFRFRVSVGPVRVSEWSYSFEDTATVCRVIESWTDLRPNWVKPLGVLVTGVRDRATHNRSGMAQTLSRLAAAVESEGGS